MRKHGLKLVAVVLLLVPLAACSRAVPQSDTFICVYGDRNHGQKLKYQLPPGSTPKSIGGDDEVVEIPTSNRFFMATEDDGIRDPLAPNYYRGFDEHGVEVHIEGQVRFRFNQSKICEWYAKHGRRNVGDAEDLQFNARGDSAGNSGWLHFLAENFGVTMQQIINGPTHRYTWNALTFDFPVNANEVGDLPVGQKPGESTRVVFGQDVGALFSTRLNANLGGNYFCGIDAGVTGESTDCPSINFQVIKVEPTDKSLLTDGQRLQSLKEQLRNAANELKLQTDKLGLLQAQLKVAQLQAQIDKADCLLLASKGLDCDGHHAPVYSGYPPQQ